MPGGTRVRERPPGEVLLLDNVLQILAIAADVDADQDERPILQGLYERPLVRPLAPSSQSVFGPEVEQHDFPAVVAQFELVAVLIFAIDVLGFLADGEVAHLE